jgi:chaperone modulatory protein CbpM
MAGRTDTPLRGQIVEEELTLTLEEISCACTVEPEQLVSLVEVGVLEPVGDKQGHLHFTGVSLIRARTALRLQHDLGINPPGLAVVLDLLEQVNMLRRRLEQIE